MNADYFVLLGYFTLGDCRYFPEEFLSCLHPEFLYRIIKTMNERNYKFLWTNREERICLGFLEESLRKFEEILFFFVLLHELNYSY